MTVSIFYTQGMITLIHIQQIQFHAFLIVQSLNVVMLCLLDLAC